MAYNENSIVFITKDAFCKDYLPCYGNQYWKGKTPNIDELIGKGTVFYRHYTGAPSTVMANMCMFTGLFPHQSELSHYYFSNIHYSGESLWTKAVDHGFSCHIIWDEAWTNVFKMKERYYCYGEETIIHNIKNLRQGVGAHYVHKDTLKADEDKVNSVLEVLRNTILDITDKADKVFLWLHIPHVIYGRTSYGSDIDVFDKIVGLLRKFFDDSNIFISGDHGNMNGHKGKVGYGYDVYEPAISIPLITPKIDNKTIVNDVTSNVDIGHLIFDREITKREFVFCDSAFYAQPNRKLAIIHGRYKYIYNKYTGKEELYDVLYDPEESRNIINEMIFDKDRSVSTPLNELYFYPYWDNLESEKEFFRMQKKAIWRKGSFFEEFKPWIKYFFLTHGGNMIIRMRAKK